MMLVCICPNPMDYCPAFGAEDITCYPWCEYLHEEEDSEGE